MVPVGVPNGECMVMTGAFLTMGGGSLADKAHKYKDATEPHGEYLLRNRSNCFFESSFNPFLIQHFKKRLDNSAVWF